MRCTGSKEGLAPLSRAHAGEGGFYGGRAGAGELRQAAPLRIAGVPVGREITEGVPKEGDEDGSIIVVVATDAPCCRTLKRLRVGRARSDAQRQRRGQPRAIFLLRSPLPMPAQTTGRRRGEDAENDR